MIVYLTLKLIHKKYIFINKIGVPTTDYKYCQITIVGTLDYWLFG